MKKYAAIMKEIKLRTEVIRLFLSGACDAHYVPTTVETIGLQFRKIFELIAFSSLAALAAATAMSAPHGGRVSVARSNTAARNIRARNIPAADNRAARNSLSSRAAPP
jgi:hypothetical protein